MDQQQKLVTHINTTAIAITSATDQPKPHRVFQVAKAINWCQLG